MLRRAQRATADWPQRASQAADIRCAAPRAAKRRRSNLKRTNCGFDRSGQERPRRKHGDEAALPRDRGGARDHARDRRQTGLVAAARRERCAVLARGVDVDHRDAAPRRCWTAIRRAIAEACSDSNTSK